MKRGNTVRVEIAGLFLPTHLPLATWPGLHALTPTLRHLSGEKCFPGEVTQIPEFLRSTCVLIRLRLRGMRIFILFGTFDEKKIKVSVILVCQKYSIKIP